jgi:membrane-anchored mycosin MYCP
MAGAVALTFLFGTIGSGLAPVPAAAQQEEKPPWAPQGPISSSVPKDTGRPAKPHEQVTECIESSFTQREIPSEQILKEGPWAQRFLRIHEVQQYVRQRSPHGKVGWNDEKNRPIKIAVIDTGVTPNDHLPASRLEAGGDYIEGADGAQGLEDCDGHGTQVAGIIAANPKDPSIGFTGVAPDAHIISIRQSSQNWTEKSDEQIEREREERREAERQRRKQQEAEQRAREAEQKLEQLQEEIRKTREEAKRNNKTSSSQQAPNEPRAQDNPAGAGNLDTLAQAIVRAVDKGADVINMSVDACRPLFPNDDHAFRPQGDEVKVRAALKYAADRNVVAVAAAGNAAPPNSGGTCLQNDAPLPEDPRVPPKHQPRTLVIPPWFSADGTVLAVAAIGRDGSVADFSMRGPWVSVAAPGTEIISIDPAGTNAIINATFNGDRTKPQPLQGTSFAAPYVAGVAALVKQMHPELTAREIIERIQRTAQHPGAAAGRDQFVGYGVIDPMAAVSDELPDAGDLEHAEDRALPSDMPPLNEPDPVPMYVALGGTGGAFAALGITLFVVRSVRRYKAKKASA